MTIDYSKLDFGDLFKPSSDIDYSLIPKTKANNFDNFCFDKWMSGATANPIAHQYHCDLACKEVQYPGCIDFLSQANSIWLETVKQGDFDGPNKEKLALAAKDKIYLALSSLAPLDSSKILEDNNLNYSYLIEVFFQSFKPERLVQEFIDFAAQDRSHNANSFSLISLPINVFPGYKNLYINPVYNAATYSGYTIFSMSSHYQKLLTNLFTAIELMLTYSPLFCKVYKHPGFNWADKPWEELLSVPPKHEPPLEGTMFYRAICSYEEEEGFTAGLFNNNFAARPINYNETPLKFYSSKFKTYLSNLGVGQMCAELANPIIALKMFCLVEVFPYFRAIETFLLQSGFSEAHAHTIACSPLFTPDLKIANISTSQKVIETTLDFHKSFMSHFTQNIEAYRQFFLFFLGLSTAPRLFKISDEKINDIVKQLESKETNSFWNSFQSLQNKQLKSKLKSKVI